MPLLGSAKVTWSVNDEHKLVLLFCIALDCGGKVGKEWQHYDVILEKALCVIEQHQQHSDNKYNLCVHCLQGWEITGSERMHFETLTYLCLRHLSPQLLLVVSCPRSERWSWGPCPLVPHLSVSPVTQASSSHLYNLHICSVMPAQVLRRHVSIYLAIYSAVVLSK